MKTEDFINGLKEELEIESAIDTNTNLKELEEWDSLNGMILISFVNENFGLSLTGEEVNKITTVQSLMDKIGLDKFENS